jgi:TrmH family RNA methyltransferase
VIDGQRLIEDLVRWGVEVRELYVATSLAAGDAARRLGDAAEQAWAVDDGVLGAISPTRHAQGLLAIAAEPQSRPWSMEDGVAVFLDGVQEPGNVGAIVRSAAALGAAAVLLSDGCADPLHWAAVRASAGGVFKVPVEGGKELSQVAARVRQRGGRVWATGGHGVGVEQWSPSEPALLLLGAEGGGLGAVAAAAADDWVTVPVERGMDSLNIAVAAGILLHAYRRCRGTDQQP